MCVTTVAVVREVERRMGAVKYFLCFWQRKAYLKDLVRAEMLRDKEVASLDVVVAVL